MKKTIYISGVIIANLLVIGCIFKVNHWPGAGVALTLSLLLLCFWFLPVALINHYKGQKIKTAKWLYIAAFISFFMVFISALFKIQHWHGAGLLLLIGVPIPFLLYLPVFIFHSVKNKEQSPVNFTAIILGLIFIAVLGVLLSINVSNDVLFHGIALTKSNEKVIDYYQFVNNKVAGQSNKEIQEFVNESDRICDLIHQAKKDLLIYSDNAHINTDLGQEEFAMDKLNNVDSKTMSQYVLIWREGAIVPVLEKELKSYKEYAYTLPLKKVTLSRIEDVINLDKQLIDSEEYSWIEREFGSDYFVFALESLSRWEKNIRFVEHIVLNDLSDKEEKEL
ncbi:MAG: hypothetical protein ACQERU_13365 [Bacteroidota bacterium]